MIYLHLQWNSSLMLGNELQPSSTIESFSYLNMKFPSRITYYTGTTYNEINSGLFSIIWVYFSIFPFQIKVKK